MRRPIKDAPINPVSSVTVGRGVTAKLGPILNLYGEGHCAEGRWRGAVEYPHSGQDRETRIEAGWYTTVGDRKLGFEPQEFSRS